MEKQINERVRNILINDFKFGLEPIEFLEASEDFHAREGRESPYEIIQTINKSFEQCEQMNEKEKEYLKFVIAFKIAWKNEMNRQIPYNPEWSKNKKIYTLRRSLEWLDRVKKIALKLRKTMPYYIQLF